MTDLFADDVIDTGEINNFHQLELSSTVVIPAPDITQNLAPYVVERPPAFRRPPASGSNPPLREGIYMCVPRAASLADTVTIQPPTPGSPPGPTAPGPLPSPDGPPPGPPKPTWTARSQEYPPVRRSVPYQLPEGHEWAGPQHRKPAPAWTRWAIAVGTMLTAVAALTLIVLAVFR